MSLSRRDFLAAVSAVAPAAVMPSARGSETKDFPRGKAEHCIFVWLGGGAAQIDTWDPKRRGDAKAGKAGSYYDVIPTAISGVEVCGPLARCAPILDRFALLRTVHHEVIDEHARATNQVHTGRPTAGTITYPSIGSAVSHTRGPINDRVPAYILIGYPNVTRGPGFLGAEAGFVYLTDTRMGPAGFARQPEITDARQRRREALLDDLRKGHGDQAPMPEIVADYDAASRQAFRMAGPDFMQLFQLDAEPASLRDGYGGEFGQRLLLSRRLVEGGVRFIEVSHNLGFLNGTGWDTHNEGQLKQHLLIEELDRGLAALVLDLETKNLLDKTLVVVATEFGRPAQFDGGGGRGHHSKCFSMVMAGGGLNTGRAIGTSDDLAMTPVADPISIPDVHATIHAALGTNPAEELYDGARPVPLTDGGVPIASLF
ncbi:MAG: DUF1501 domain-containing protein [Planctomycetia bacterium]